VGGPTRRCAGGHAFDVAREGYVNLLLPQHRRSTEPGYGKEMIAGRRAFFDAGHYEPLADAVADLVVSHLPTDGPPGAEPVVLDAGCGEGYYLRRLRHRLRANGSGQAVLVGLDLSKPAIKAAARRDPAGRYAVAGTFRMPVLASRVDVLLTHFSPVSPADFRRVVRPGGVLLLGGPGPAHLFGLKEILYDTPAHHEPPAGLDQATGFELLATHRIQFPLRLGSPKQVANLLKMTPFSWAANRPAQERLAGLDALGTEVDVVVRAYRRR
jgi:23S rRNA (guanine745-N1)-methyltransferase